MNETSKIPSAVSLSELKRQHNAIVGEAIRSGYTYEQIASILDFDSGAELRRYLQRTTTHPPRRNNPVLLRIHDALLDNENEFTRIIPETLVSHYRAVVEGKRSDTITYTRGSDADLDIENRRALSLIGHDVFRADYNHSMHMLRRICGNYYAYRISTTGSSVVKSLLSIVYHEDELFVEFFHYHPDRFYGQRPEDTARRTHGLAFYSGPNIFLIGNTECGQAINVFAMREPLSANFYIILGYNLAPNLDRVLMSARTVFIKQKKQPGETDEQASERYKSGIGRIDIKRFDKTEHDFDIALLANPGDQYFCENISLIRFPYTLPSHSEAK